MEKSYSKNTLTLFVKPYIIYNVLYYLSEGGADILLPDNVNIKVNSNSLFGGVDNKNHQNLKDNAHTVYLNGTCIFGGVDVK